MHLYLHYPFCRRRCPYCDFPVALGGEETRRRYVEALLREIDAFPERPAPSPLGPTLYLGGGTPSLLEPGDLERILAALVDAGFPLGRAEVTLEANPTGLTRDRLAAYRSLGVTRISLGVQSFRDGELAFLGRLHSAREAWEAAEAVAAAGFPSWNLDLIYGLPGQELEDWTASIERALALEPPHLSLYALTVEPRTPLALWVRQGRVPAPDPDRAAELYRWSQERLARAGYERYEISNWARPGHACRHNLGYWAYADWWGIGAGAHGHLGRLRYANDPQPRRYLRTVLAGGSPRRETIRLSPQAYAVEGVILGLRRGEGLSWPEWARWARAADVPLEASPWGVDLPPAWREAIRWGEEVGLLTVDGQGVRLSEDGVLLANQVLWRFLLEEGDRHPRVSGP